MSFTLPSDDEIRRIFSLLDEKDTAEMTKQFDADVARANNTESKREESVNKKMKHSNETKRELFKRFAKIVAEDLLSGAEYSDDDGYIHYKEDINIVCQEYMDNYDKALPDDLPTIPKAVGEWIIWCKEKGGIGNVSDAIRYSCKTISAWIYDERNSDIFARAWLLGVWRVEKTGEIVKLEEENHG